MDDSPWALFSPTRICPPKVRADVVERERLSQCMRESLGHCKLLLLCAPAGYGKTVALVQALRRLPAGTALAWVSASEDDDLQRVIACLVAALDPHDLPWRVSPQVLPQLATGDLGVGAVVTELLGALDGADVAQGLIVVDDVHRYADPRIFQFFKAVLARLPSRWTVAMACREAPPLPLARMRLEGDMVELRQSDLRFHDDEARLLAQALCVALPEAEDWQLRTQGWPAGLVAALMSQGAQGGSPRARVVAQRHMFEYLAEEVMATLPEPLQRFLLRCSVLSELTVARCRHVSGDVQAAHWLHEIERRELFVAVLAVEQQTLRLHDLFREFLQERLRQELPLELASLLQRAAEQESDVVARVGLLLRAGRTDDAVAQMLAAAMPMLEAGGREQLLRLLAQFPPPVRAASPELAFVEGMCAVGALAFATLHTAMSRAWAALEARGQWQLAMKARALDALGLVLFERVADGRAVMASAPALEMDPDTEIVWRLSAFRLSTHDGPAHETPQHLRRISQLLALHPQLQGWMFLGQMLYGHIGRRGVSEPMRELVAQLPQASDEPSYLRVCTLTLRAWLALWSGDWQSAGELADEVESDVHWLGDVPAIRLLLQVLRGTQCQLRGDAAGMLRCLREVRDRALGSAERRSGPLYSSLLCAYAVANEDWGSAREALAVACPHDPTLDSVYLRVATGALQAELLLQQGRLDPALALFRSVGPQAEAADGWGLHARVCAGWARAELRGGDLAAAWRALSPALHTAIEANEPLGLLLCGPAVLEELAAVSWPAGLADEALRRLLERCARQARELRSGAAVPVAHAAAELSEREVQVLRLIAGGQSNKHIARALGLSPHTVKRHVARILDKTGRNSRLQAAAWLRASGHAQA